MSWGICDTMNSEYTFDHVVLCICRIEFELRHLHNIYISMLVIAKRIHWRTESKSNSINLQRYSLAFQWRYFENISVWFFVIPTSSRCCPTDGEAETYLGLVHAFRPHLAQAPKLPQRLENLCVHLGAQRPSFRENRT